MLVEKDVVEDHGSIRKVRKVRKSVPTNYAQCWMAWCGAWLPFRRGLLFLYFPSLIFSVVIDMSLHGASEYNQMKNKYNNRLQDQTSRCLRIVHRIQMMVMTRLGKQLQCRSPFVSGTRQAWDPSPSHPQLPSPICFKLSPSSLDYPGILKIVSFILKHHRCSSLINVHCQLNPAILPNPSNTRHHPNLCPSCS